MKGSLDKITDSFMRRVNVKVSRLKASIEEVNPVSHYGKVTSAIGTVVFAVMADVKIGDLCEIFDRKTGFILKAEVIAIDCNKVTLLPFGSIKNIAKDFLIKKIEKVGFSIKIGEFLLGKIVNGFGEIHSDLNGSNDFELQTYESYGPYPIDAPAPDAMNRPIIEEALKTGVTTIDMLVTCGYGQRIAIFAKAGLGKTTLMGMILRNSAVDIIVIALIGERGREVKEFIDLELSEEIRNKCIIVVSTSDKPPIEQMKCAFVAQTIAEYFRDQGKNVMLFVDSITRFARAVREIGLSAGEPPARSGYPPSTFLAFPRLMERAGNNKHGSITAFYTVLLETDNFNNDPIADEVKSILDGHILLSDKYAKASHFPAIDPLLSLSRIADRIISKEHMECARKLRMLIAKYEEIEFLIRVGEYVAGKDHITDEAFEKHQEIMKFLQQSQTEVREFNSDLSFLKKIIGDGLIK